MKNVVDLTYFSFEAAEDMMEIYRAVTRKPDYQGIRAELDTGMEKHLLFSNDDLTFIGVFSLHYEGGAGSFYLHECDDANEAFTILKSSIASMIME